MVRMVLTMMLTMTLMMAMKRTTMMMRLMPQDFHAYIRNLHSPELVNPRR